MSGYRGNRSFGARRSPEARYPAGTSTGLETVAVDSGLRYMSTKALCLSGRSPRRPALISQQDPAWWLATQTPVAVPICSPVLVLTVLVTLPINGVINPTA